MEVIKAVSFIEDALELLTTATKCKFDHCSAAFRFSARASMHEGVGVSPGRSLTNPLWDCGVLPIGTQSIWTKFPRTTCTPLGMNDRLVALRILFFGGMWRLVTSPQLIHSILFLQQLNSLQHVPSVLCREAEG